MISTISNICLQIIEALISFYFYEKITHNAKGKIRNVAIIIVAYMAMCAINLYFDYNAVINTSILVASHFLFLLILYRQKVTVSLLYSVIFSGMVAASEIGVANFVAIISDTQFGDYTDDILQYVLLIVFSKSILLFGVEFIGAFINKFKSHERIMAVYFTYPLSLIVIFTVFNVLSFRYNLANKDKMILLVCSIIMVVAIIVTWLFQYLSSQKEQELIELKAIQQKQEIDNTYFELIEHQNDELQIFVHDMKNHLTNILNLSGDQEKIQEYISSLSIDLSNSNKLGKTSSKLLDLIIDKYSYISQKRNILFETEVHSSDLSFIQDNDLTSIFNNLFDNAVEAASESQEKRIKLSINTYGKILAIDLSNSCDRCPLTDGNKLVSTKKDGLHGYGFRSISKSVKKYNGDLEWEYDDNEKTFNISIMFSIA